MKIITFTKYEGLGNDFIIIDESQHKNGLSPSLSLSARISLCDRESGIGADGVITIMASPRDDSCVFMHVTNSDGSVPENCGNGLRCVAKWLYENGRVLEGQDFFIDTYSGRKRACVKGESVEIGLGIARVNLDFLNSQLSETISKCANEAKIEPPKILAYAELGNPHLILESIDYEKARILLGPKIEKMPVFPNGVNVSFVCLKSRDEIYLRVFERGAGATKACGTGAGATVAALVESGLFDNGSTISVFFEDGKLEVRAQAIRTREYEITISGQAKKQNSGEWKISE